MLQKTYTLFLVAIYFTFFLLFSPLGTKEAIAYTFFDDFESDTTSWSEVFGSWYRSSIDGSYRYGGTYGSCCMESVAGDINWANYIYTVKLLGKRGVDKNLIFRYISPSIKYGIHLTSSTISLEKHTNTQSSDIFITSANFTNNIVYNIRVELFSNNIKVFVNDYKYIDYTDLNDPILNGKIGLRIGAGAVTPSEVWFDDVAVEVYSTATNTPSPTPTPTLTPSPMSTPTPTLTPTPTITSTPTPTPISTPTITPTPTSTTSSLNIPNYKQYQGGWENNIYDHTEKYIKNLGCALTSASMVLSYYGHNITPDILNNWLNSQPDGYIGYGLINWLAVSRYTKINDSPISPTLEYKRYPFDINILNNELNVFQPAILKVPGHFIVAKEKQNNIYNINDPGYSNRDTLNSYSNNFIALNSYKPTHSDLSYLMFVADSDLSLTLYDQQNNQITSDNFIEEPINDIFEPNSPYGQSVSVLLFAKPSNSNYKLKVEGPKGNYELKTYLYDNNGNVTNNSFKGLLFGNDTDIYNIKYSTHNISMSITEILFDLNTAYKNKLIKNKQIYESIKSQILMYKKYHFTPIIKSLILQIKLLTPKFIDYHYSQTLQQNLQNLI